MIERIIEYSVRNPLLVIVAALAVAGIGVYSVINTPIDAIPDLSENQVIVFADWPGRSPKEVEDQVTYPLSVNLQGLAGVKAIRATSEFGFSMINIIFEDKIDFYFARQRVLERLSIASTFLPTGVAPYLAPDATALGQIFWYTVEGGGNDLGRLRAIQDWYVRYQLYSVAGVAEVASVGGFPIEYQVDIDPNKLRAYGVTLGEVYSAVERSNSSVGGRIIQKANSEYLVRSIGWIASLDDVAQDRHQVDGRHADLRQQCGDRAIRLDDAAGQPGKERQRSGRRRRADALRRESARSHRADQGEDRAAAGRPARRCAHRAVLRPHVR